MLFHRHTLLFELIVSLIIVQFELSVPIIKIGQLLILKLGFFA